MIAADSNGFAGERAGQQVESAIQRELESQGRWFHDELICWRENGD